MKEATRRIPAHDSLVRNVLGRRRAIAVLLRRMLHPTLLRCIDFGSLRAGPTIHTDDGLRTRVLDLCFIVDLVRGRRRYPLLIVIEHRSRPAPRMPWRAHVYVGDVWRWYIKDHPGPPYDLPFVLPILLVQHPARSTPTRLSSLLAMPPGLRRLLGTTVELSLLVDDFSGSVLGDPVADPATLALVEVTRAFLHAYQNPRSLTKARLATLAAQLEILLARNSPDPDRHTTGLDDIRALWTYVICVFEEGSPLRTILLQAVSRPVREAYMTIEKALLAKGKKLGVAEGKKLGVAEGKKLGVAEGKKLGVAEGKRLGVAEGRAAAILDLLELRAVPVPRPVRRRVLATRDESQLQRWLARALTVPTAHRLFDSGRA